MSNGFTEIDEAEWENGETLQYFFRTSGFLSWAVIKKIMHFFLLRRLSSESLEASFFRMKNIYFSRYYFTNNGKLSRLPTFGHLCM